MGKYKHIIVSALVALLVSIIAVKTLQPTSTSTSAKESTYDRVMRTKTIRCGYLVIPPMLTKDIKTGEFGGLVHDVLEMLATQLEVKIDWTQETSLSSYVQDLNDNKIDMMCMDLYYLPKYSRFTETTTPVWYKVLRPIVRTNDTRFDTLKPEDINHPEFRISTVDGAIPEDIAKENYPKATIVSVPQTNPYSDSLLNVANGKADITFIEDSVLTEFQKHNPGKLKIVANWPATRIYPNGFPVKKGEHDFMSMLNIAIQYAQINGFMDKAIAPYNNPQIVYLPEPPKLRKNN